MGEREQRMCGATKGEPSTLLCDRASTDPGPAMSERGSSRRLTVMRLGHRQPAYPRVTRRRSAPARPLLGLSHVPTPPPACGGSCSLRASERTPTAGSARRRARRCARDAWTALASASMRRRRARPLRRGGTPLAARTPVRPVASALPHAFPRPPPAGGRAPCTPRRRECHIGRGARGFVLDSPFHPRRSPKTGGSRCRWRRPRARPRACHSAPPRCLMS